MEVEGWQLLGIHRNTPPIGRAGEGTVNGWAAKPRTTNLHSQFGMHKGEDDDDRLRCALPLISPMFIGVENREAR
jgi:hypothetical protein